MEPDTPLDTDRHLRYLQRCLRSLLPHQYTSNDSTRMTLACFVLAAIDLLTPTSATAPSASSKKAALTPTDRRLFREWVLACQHPGGGFCGSPTHALPAAERATSSSDDGADGNSASSGTANIAATYFALQLLALLADEESAESAFLGVDRRATLRWLRSLQRDDGSFGEVLVRIPAPGGGWKQLVAGGRDTRYCYLASMIRWVLRADTSPNRTSSQVDDIDVDALVRYIKNNQTYDGGFGESSSHESHAGYAYCAIAALAILDRPPEGSTGKHTGTPALSRVITDRPALINWLASRSFAYIPPSSRSSDEDDDDSDTENFALPTSLASLTLSDNLTHIGYNGRCNKIADTCYCWWVSGALSILGESGLISAPASRRFLLDQTQHNIGGFAKNAGGPPDIYHAYLGLAALATMGEPTLKKFDTALCISTDTVKKVEAGRRGLLRKEGEQGLQHTKDLIKIGAELLGRDVDWLSVGS